MLLFDIPFLHEERFCRGLPLRVRDKEEAQHEGEEEEEEEEEEVHDRNPDIIFQMIAQVTWAPNYLETIGWSAAPETPTVAPNAVALAAPVAAAVPATVTPAAAPVAAAFPTAAAVPAAAAAAGRLRPASAILDQAEWIWRMRNMELEDADAEDDRAYVEDVEDDQAYLEEADAAAGASGGRKGACRGTGGKGTDNIQDVGWGDRNDRGGSKGKAVLASAAASSSAHSAAAADSSGCSSVASAAAAGSGWGKGWQSQAWISSPSSPWPQSQSETWWAEYRRQGQGGCPSQSQPNYASRSQVMQCNSDHGLRKSRIVTRLSFLD